MKNLGTANYLQKRVINFLFNEKWYNRIKLTKIVFCYKLNIPYEMSTILKDLLTDDSVVFDIGANMGQYACRLNSIVQKGKGHVYCFEPVSTNFIALRDMKKILHMNNVTINQLGVGNVVENKTINIPMFDNGLVVGTRASLLEMNEVIHKTESIKVTTIDTFFSEMKVEKLDFIKCDTEGNEANVLEGGRETITRFRPILSFEMSYKSSNLKWLLDLGYEMFYFDAHTNKLRKINGSQKGNLILLNKKHIDTLNKIIE
jgi:FkbM family methyltransferase